MASTSCPYHSLDAEWRLVQATNGFRQAEKAFETLYARLCAPSCEVHEEIVSCLVMILQALDDRHYQRANEIYLQLSIGNQTWPIGVTSIGIHDRTAREKLSFYANVKSQVCCSTSLLLFPSCTCVTELQRCGLLRHDLELACRHTS